ncbi:MAG: GSCFA domain-containing protein [Saprospiraceae bacterium]|jgi:hypothetical protein|uniref:GSCFA domain-containing protein n=1 Tax=Candidatus Brachybacter algidus TaxID=2982024 RepID=UPI001B5B87D8|nr:GSCFA domain-containing protein [Candidatus Brachybacter algidus]MBP7307045.1 GSCFA domain-containing protein [Saprospiraceae bacterium]MBK6448274.1 GSCFA domain-containing protein [Candidatus Brachybacter algidus]MBK7605495.1 GSCFA domain-containing protein [Candidatus Brachybacter algidus]MBK8354239.1 GSCFA domain-containing protein [Candidatus Brachybacter algidus]MBL0118335.1 GSCFA domain-containing protein [Candidatus Brachybacter algidus]
MDPLFRTIIRIPPSRPISLASKCMMIGSCFSEEISEKLIQSGLSVINNPAGILFNPLSILNILERIRKEQLYIQSELQIHNNQFFSWEHHGSFKHQDREILLNKINSLVQQSIHYNVEHPVRIITWGSAIIYRIKETGQVVANCHKQPSSIFHRKMLTVDELVNQYVIYLEKMLPIEPGFRVIITVSPVRYAKDGFVENQLSKSILFVALNKLIELYPENIEYFPAYEIIMDELRDYRFYKSDMIHPSQVAVDLVWQYFQKTYFTATDQKVLKEIEAFNSLSAHRPLFPDSEESAQLQNTIETKRSELSLKYPYLNI